MRGNLVVFVLIATLLVFGAQAQTFSSGSTGSDGALNLTTPGTVVFDPTTFSPPLNPAGDNVFNFTTINIASGVTVKLKSSLLRGRSLVWLASGAVMIAGTLDLSGADGYAGGGITSTRVPSEAGPGGYQGGLGIGANGNPTAGSGPGGGGLASNGGNGGGAYHATPGSTPCCNATGGVYDNPSLIPLRGGSGGAGGNGNGSGGGGAGGGAIRIVSSVSIAVSGTILANGGAGGAGPANAGGGGSGGSIHLIAPTINGAGSISALGASSSSQVFLSGGNGWLRLDAYTQSFSGTLNGVTYYGTPSNVPLPAPPYLNVTSIGGVNPPAFPTGSFVVPDAVINQPGAATVVIHATNVPVGTVVTVYIVSQSGPDQSVQSTALAGTLTSSTATASITFPPGYSNGYVSASW